MYQRIQGLGQSQMRLAALKNSLMVISPFLLLIFQPFLSEITLICEQHKQKVILDSYNNTQTMTTFQSIKTVNCEETPCSRWGHSMISIQNQIYIFGGYENSKYYNDLWRFDLTTLTFERVNQQGEVPPPCSNFTLNYYQHQNTLLLFGGGTLNKEKLNTIYKLDMSTFTWRKQIYDESTSLPWQRSYHCAEIIGHYLVITGGEFFHDLDDIWIYDLNTNEWKQIKLNEGALKPKARKFASSFVVNNKLYIVGGCSGKYECVEDCFQMNFSQFLESGNLKSLAWKKVEISNKELLVRWGHISLAKGNKAYLFGGRQGSKDLQNLIEIDLSTYSCHAIDFKGSNPKGRRRPGVCIKNNTLFCFSGFDGSYVKDFIYFNLPTSLDTAIIKEDIDGKNSLLSLLTPNNIQESCINFDDEVFYVADEQFEDIQLYLSKSKPGETVRLFKDINYNINIKKIVSKSPFFANFLNGCYHIEELNIYCPESLSKKERTILSKMFLSYFCFGKVIVERCEFINSKKYFVNLLEIANYYCCDDLSEICKKELLKFFTDEIVSHKSSIQNIISMCEVMTGINKQYENYAGYFMLTKLVQKNRNAVNTLNDFKQYIKGNKQLTQKEWMFRMIEEHSFELSQLIMRKKEVDFENINSVNIPHKEEILYEKTRKGSMHSKHMNA